MLNLAIKEMKLIFGDDRRRIDHALTVLEHSCSICARECPGNQAVRKTVELAAVLHDIGIKQAEAKYNSAAPVYQHREGPPLAERILKKVGADKAMASRVLYIIGHHHLKKQIDGLDFQILWEADLIANLPAFPVFSSAFDKYEKMVNNNFQTKAGKEIALGLKPR